MTISRITFKTVIKDILQTILQGSKVSTRHTLSGSLFGSSLSIDYLLDSGSLFLFFLPSKFSDGTLPNGKQLHVLHYRSNIMSSTMSQNQNSDSPSKRFVFKFHATERLCLTTLKWLRAVFLTELEYFLKKPRIWDGVQMYV